MVPGEETSSSKEEREFLLRFFISKEKFVRGYEEVCRRKGVRQLYLLILSQLEVAISQGNINMLRKLDQFIDYLSGVEDKSTLRSYYDDPRNLVQAAGLLITACKHNMLICLQYLLGSDCKILNNLPTGADGSLIAPHHVDQMSHNAFYYAIRSGNCELVDTLMKKWPGNYFTIRSEELDEILSQAYEELKLKNVPLSDEMEFFVENKLINLRFFSNGSPQDQVIVKDVLNNIRERIQLVLQNIDLLKAEYLNAEKVDGKFLFIAKFIAQNIHVLKRQLKCTYDRLPWEEIEFCLVSFISSRLKRQEINLFYNATLNKSKILYHLENFGNKLIKEKEILKSVEVGKLANLPNLKREKAVGRIIGECPQFEGLYKDYQLIRDIHSLWKISDYIKLALSADPVKREGQIIITRVLQVMGEYLKNTLESPKLSSMTSELLLLSLPKNTRQIVIDLRNSISHAYSLSKRTQIEEYTDINFFIGIQNDTKRIDNVITDILLMNKFKTTCLLLKKIADSDSFEDIKEVAETLSNFELNEAIFKKFNYSEHDVLEKTIKQLSDCITNKTNHEKELFNKINMLLDLAKNKLKCMKTDYVSILSTLWSIGKDFMFNDNMSDKNLIRGTKFIASQALKNIPSKMEPHNIKEIVQLSLEISKTASLRMGDENLEEIRRLTFEIFRIAELESGNLQWIEELREKLNEKIMLIPPHEACDVLEVSYDSQLGHKLSELKQVFKKNSLNGRSVGKLAPYKENKKLQAVVEMLLLDIMSILGLSDKCLENNFLFVDGNAPLLIGKCLRNHLAHDNILNDILLSDPSVAVVLNAKTLTSEKVITKNQKIGKLIRDDPSKLKTKFSQSLIVIANQEKTFAALEAGNLEDLKACLKKGGDISGRSINSWTVLHFAAKGHNVEIIKFLIDEKICASVKDENGQRPIHIAATHGRTNIVEFFLRHAGVCVDDIDNLGRSPLHLAAKNGHEDTVLSLLKNNAKTNIKDIPGFSPLHYAIKNNHIEVTKALLEKESNVDINEVMGGFTPLHVAAENGYLDLVIYLLKKGANIHSRSHLGGTPLHPAALNGHLEVVNALILGGADVNSRVIDGCTPLHYAVETGSEKVANLLLEHGADPNIADKTYKNTPLHYAAKDGHIKIVNALMEKNADASVTTTEGLSPLHFASLGGHLDIVSVLLKLGVNIHARAKDNGIPLHCAVVGGHKEVAELLMKSGAEINARTNNNLTPLHVAAQNGHNEIIKLLISYKAEIDAENVNGDTPLHNAAKNGYKDVIDLLLKSKADVNARNKDGLTPLHIAALNGHEKAAASLVKSKANVNTKACIGLTPLCMAVIGGHKDIVRLLIKHYSGNDLFRPLELAVEGHKEIVDILIASGADVKRNGLKPLLSAIKHNQKEIVEVLIENGARVNGDCGEPLCLAVTAGYRDIVEILLKNNASVNMKGEEGLTVLHLAAATGHKRIVNILISRGAQVDAVTLNKQTPLFVAAQLGHDEVVEILVANRAKVDFLTSEGTPIHMAAALGHDNVVKFLLSKGAAINIKDYKSRTPLELAVARGHMKVVKTLLEYKKVDLNAKGNDDWTILHIASQEKNLEMIKYLVNKGCDLRAKNASGSMPIHIAAREGLKDTVEFFLKNGSSLNEVGACKQTLLHYSAMNGQLEVIKYLIEQGADVNARDTNGCAPIHFASHSRCKDAVEILLENGAFYDAIDNLYRTPICMTNDKLVKNLFASTDKLFESVKMNSSKEVENDIKAGAFVNSRNATRGTPLHYAAWKGYDQVVEVLLKKNANPNSVGNKSCTPMHYAAKASHLKIVKLLLSYGAVYNPLSESGKTPSDFTTDKGITNLFKLINDSFKKVKEDNTKVINDLNKIQDIDTIKAVMSARNRENETLIASAICNNFSKVGQLKQISQNDVSAQVDTALLFAAQGNYKKALNILRSTFERRKGILGRDNPGTLDIEYHIASILYKQGSYQESLKIAQEIYQKRKEILGSYNNDTLNTKSFIALIFHRQGRNEEALEMYEEVFEKQMEILGPDHSDVLDTQLHKALVLNELEKCEDALKINRAVYEKRKEKEGIYSPSTVSALNNIALVLAKQGKYEESLKIYYEVFEKKKYILGVNHTDTLRTLNSIGGILIAQEKHHEALKTLREVLQLQKKSLRQNHPETLITQLNIGNVLFAQGKFTNALKEYRECYDLLRSVFGESHPNVLDAAMKIEIISKGLKFQGNEESEVLRNLQSDIIVATSNGDAQSVQRLLKDGSDANERDVEGRTLLHFAVSIGRIDIVKVLLENGADVSLITNKGNTPLHTATSKYNKEIVDILLQHTSRDKLNDFINAQTTSSGSTSLHVAAKGGSLEVVKSLLKYGAAYKIKNKEGKIPINLSTNPKVTTLLKLVDDLFRDITNGNIQAIDKLKAVKHDELISITNSRNNLGKTLLQVAVANGHKNVATKLLEMLK